MVSGARHSIRRYLYVPACRSEDQTGNQTGIRFSDGCSGIASTVQTELDSSQIPSEPESNPKSWHIAGSSPSPSNSSYRRSFAVVEVSHFTRALQTCRCRQSRRGYQDRKRVHPISTGFESSSLRCDRSERRRKKVRAVPSRSDNVLIFLDLTRNTQADSETGKG